MKAKGPNHPFVVWASYFLWLISLFSITWSLLLFLFVGDMLIITGTDLVNAFVLLSGIIMLPTNVHMLYSIASGKKLDHKAKVVCCPIWLCIVWIIIINFVGVILCIQRIRLCQETVMRNLSMGMRNYRNMPKYKHFIDNLQWVLGCCGLNSYKDWFDHDWCDKMRDYEWDPSINKRVAQNKKQPTATDSVPLSCCKSGSCISNYLLELGSYSINTNGCGDLVYQIITISMNVHLVMFLTIIIVELIILKCIVKKNKSPCKSKRNKLNVRHIMPIKNNFNASSESLQLNPDDSEDLDESAVQVERIKMDIYKSAGLNQYQGCVDSMERVFE
ncbi:peripherin-2 isoform X2 [Manduca sexta]|uniref:Uncharacterized protein n=1 Tax=Manduca sexta TaxID=7130 RepID=A0A921YW71_MANSE|nr:peripherin-2 isoform X2 [Manduca sexta]KAG6446430.1 hypothetical protein O3G_MSEX004430 [Manduca sexta]KAG6446431.1 hypothetical protein O3G_MSEX004430 [Manduca sexta]